MANLNIHGLSTDTAARIDAELNTPAGQAWLARVGGLRMTNIKDEPALAAALTAQEAIGSDLIFGLAYARLLDVMAWPRDADAAHPFVFQRTPEATPEHLALIDTINARGIAQLKILDRTARRYAEGAPLLESAADRGVLTQMADQAPTPFAMGVALGWLVLHDWRAELRATDEIAS